MSDPVLQIDGLTKAFGEFVAVDGVSFEVHDDECLALIGPNGAGKTTLFDLLAGTHTPTSGTIRFRSQRIDGRSPSAIASLGIARSHQITSFFPELSAIENIRLATRTRRSDASMIDSLVRHHATDERSLATARQVLERLGMADVAGQPAQNLSHGQQRRLEIGIALGLDPELVLLDEPTAGMSGSDTAEMTTLIDEIAGEVPAILVEHDVDVVMDVADRIAVLHGGSILTIDAPAAVREDDRVQEVYLGGETGV